jgi:hypothetical protein
MPDPNAVSAACLQHGVPMNSGWEAGAAVLAPMLIRFQRLSDGNRVADVGRRHRQPTVHGAINHQYRGRRRHFPARLITGAALMTTLRALLDPCITLRACAFLMIGVLVGCASPTKQQQMLKAEEAIVDEAMALQRCMSTNGYSSERCAAQQKTYDSHVASFKKDYVR